jgi:hypothetical protein
MKYLIFFMFIIMFFVSSTMTFNDPVIKIKQRSIWGPCYYVVDGFPFNYILVDSCDCYDEGDTLYFTKDRR